MTRVPAATVAVYHAATYEIGAIRLRIGEPNDGIAAMLRAAGAVSAVIVTAYNPESVALCEAENRAAHENLVHAVAAYETRATCAVDPSGVWPPEPGLLVLGMSDEDAVALGARFRQNAIVCLAVDEAPKLVLLR